MKIIKYLLLLIFSGIIGITIFIYSGVYPMGADEPHFRFVYWILE